VYGIGLGGGYYCSFLLLWGVLALIGLLWGVFVLLVGGVVVGVRKSVIIRMVSISYSVLCIFMCLVRNLMVGGLVRNVV